MLVNRNALHALAAAALFGASTPLAKALLEEASPVLLAGLLYLGSGLGLLVIRLFRDQGWRPAGLSRAEWPWLLGAILFGGILGPLALVFGLSTTTASTASLLLNLEAVLTAVIAWLVFKENADRRIIVGMALIVAGGVALSWPGRHVGASDLAGPLAVAAACACWAIDNNLTRKVSATDALFIAGSKGLIAGTVNCAIAATLGASLPSAGAISLIMTVGLFGYGLSLVLFVLALRGLGAARTGAYFSTAPFLGAAISVVAFGEQTDTLFWLASALMAAGVWLHLTEQHDHEHTHEAIAHSHQHTHDLHHQHDHGTQVPWNEAHSHWHEHEPMTHKHPHYPDIHHRHSH